jgi:hypothetical protein
MCVGPIHRQQRELEVMQKATARMRTRATSKLHPQAAVVLPETSAEHAASAPQMSTRQDAAAANAAHMVDRGVASPAMAYPTAAAQSSPTAHSKLPVATSGATTFSTAVGSAPTTPVPYAAVHSQLEASTTSAHSNTSQAAVDDDTAQRLATTTSYSVLGASYSEYARAAMLRAATDAGSAATVGVHSVQPIMLAQQQQTEANTVDLTRSESPHKATVNKIPELVTPASCYGVQQLWSSPVTSSTTTTSTAHSSGRRNAMVCDEQVAADFRALSLTAEVRYSVHTSRVFVAIDSYGVLVS